MRTIALIGAAAMMALAVSPAQAQYTNPYTGRTFNNPNSSLLDTAILGASRSMMLSNSLLSGSTSSRMLAQQMKRGAQIIKSGKATTRYTPRNPFPTEFWLKRVRATDPAQRKQWAEEATLQKTLWEQEARTRGANMADMADALALTFVMAWEAQTGGEKATPAQFKGTAAGFKKMLLRDAYYQSMSQAEKQTYIEGQLLNASDPVRMLREAKQTGDAAMLKRARESGRRATATWLQTGQTHFVPNPNGFTGVK